MGKVIDNSRIAPKVDEATQKKTFARAIVKCIEGNLQYIANDPLALNDINVLKMLSGYGTHMIIAANWRTQTVNQMQKSFEWVSQWTIEKTQP